MNKRVGHKTGDTLIEVMFAVGIFSLVAVAVIAVMNGSLRSVQTALETTMARNEIDAQAEALRFIQSSAIAEKDAADGKYKEVWGEIIGRAVDGTSFNLESCADLYKNDGPVEKEKAFVINTRALGGDENVKVDNVVVSGSMGEAGVHPRLMYKDDNTTLSDNNSSSELIKAEGIYVVAVPDEKKTYYDFYIRTCWNSAGAKKPSTISTVIRLYNPNL